ncbi:MAG TPA: GGDEF domain-containing protein, partial [Armatimonadota bacterium]|nr:GGDEF domain-containing protein [Armatimonadota bacterium]
MNKSKHKTVFGIVYKAFRSITGVVITFGGLLLIAGFTLNSPIDATVAALCIIGFVAGGVRAAIGTPDSVERIEINTKAAVTYGAAIALGPITAAGLAALAALGSITLTKEPDVPFRVQLRRIAMPPVQASITGLAFLLFGGNITAPTSIDSIPAAFFAAAIFTLSEKMLNRSATPAYPLAVSLGIGYGFSGVARLLPPYALLLTALPVAMVLYKLLRQERVQQASTVETQESAPETQTETARPSLLDPLTGLANQRYLEMFLHQEVSRSERSGQPISVLLVDIDDFAKINHVDGQEAADRCLMALGAGFRRMLREYDVVARYKDDEFVLVLPDTTPEAASEIAHRIHSALSGQVMP